MTGIFGGPSQTDASPQTRAVDAITKGAAPDLSSEQKFAELVQRHDYQLKTLAQGQKQLQKGVNDATQNPIQQLQQFVSDIVVLLGGGELADGLLDFGDLQYILPALGALLGLGDGPFPIDLFQAAERFFIGYVVPTRQFTEVINKIIDAWAGLLGIDKKFVGDVNKLITSVGQLFDGLGNLLPSVESFFGALGLNPNDLGPLGVVLAPIIKLFSGIDLSSFGNAIEFITDSIDPYIVQLTAVINFANEVLAVMGAVEHGIDVINDPLPAVIVPFQNLIQFLGNTNLGIRSFNPITAAQQFIGRLNVPASTITVYGPNLQNDAGFDDPTSIADYGEWVWDLLGRTAAGAATVHADGTPHALLGTEMPVAEGQTLAVSVWALWTGVTASGSPIAIQLKTDTAGIIPIAAVASPGASSGGWVQLAGTWAVPADVNVLRIRLLVDSGCTAGQVWFDDAIIERTNLIPQAAVETLAGDLHDLFGNFTAMFAALSVGDIAAFNTALAGAVYDANRAGTLITQALSDLGLTTATQLATAITGSVTGLQTLINFLWNIFTGNTGVTGKVLADVATAGGAFFAGAAGAATKFVTLLSVTGQTTVNDLGALINLLGTMVQQVSDIFNGSIVTPINTAVQQVKDWYTANVAYLASIPNTAVQGLDGFASNLGASVQAGFDGVWQGLRAFLGVPSGIGPPQVASAGQQVRVDLNNATDIATLARTIQAAAAITKQSFLAIDPSADPVFPLSNISGASPTTVPVAQTKSVMGCVLLPDVSKKKSVTWLGGPLTNITGVYVNLYKVNKTTGEFTRFHASSNIVGSLSNPVSGTAWNFYNLPMADWFDVTVDGTGGTTTTVLGIGDYVVVEIVTAGTGTYNVVGFTNGMAQHPTVHPKALGATRTTLSPPTFDSVGAGGVGTGSASETHVIGSAATAILISLAVSGSGGATPAVTVGGVAATNLGLATWVGGQGIYVFGLMNPPTGSKLVAATMSGYTIAINSVAYTGASSFGAATTATGSGTVASQSISSTANQTVFQSISGAIAPGTITAYNRTSRWNKTGAAGVNIASQLGDFTGASGSLTGSATLPSSVGWGSVMVPINGIVAAAPSSIATPTYDTATPWIALAGAAGRSQHAAETVEFETSGAGQTYTIPTWVIDGDYIDVVAVGGGAGGSHAGTRTTTLNTAYKAGGAGVWEPTRLRYGDAYDIPTGTTTFTVNIGAGGAGVNSPGMNQAPVHGTDGGDTTVVITGVPTITAGKGVKDGTTQAFTDSLGVRARGDTPGNVAHEGVTYFGGAVCFPPAVGNSPGGGGCAGDNDPVGGQGNGSAGAPGACYITAVQN